MIALRAIESFFVGGRSVTLQGLPVTQRRMAQGAAPRTVDPNGTFITGQMYVQEFRLETPLHPLPVLLWHGGGMTGACWETTPDGRPGWLPWFLRHGFDVLVSDAVERGRAGWSRWPEIYADAPIFRTKSEAWETFRFGPAGSWHDDPGQRIAHAPLLFPAAAIDALARQFVPRWADHEAITLDAYSALLDRIGPCIVVAHSQGGGFALQAAQRRPEQVRAVVALEPSGAPPPVAPEDETRLPPHLFLWGDRVQEHAEWSRYRGVVDTYARAIAASGTIVRTIDLPEDGVFGNSHMLMMDANSDALAARVAAWLAEAGVTNPPPCPDIPTVA
jgi:pimeloyl-ACP methyl ester carboxylesterase